MPISLLVPRDFYPNTEYEVKCDVVHWDLGKRTETDAGYEDLSDSFVTENVGFMTKAKDKGIKILKGINKFFYICLGLFFLTLCLCIYLGKRLCLISPNNP